MIARFTIVSSVFENDVYEDKFYINVEAEGKLKGSNKDDESKWLTAKRCQIIGLPYWEEGKRNGVKFGEEVKGRLDVKNCKGKEFKIEVKRNVFSLIGTSYPVIDTWTVVPKEEGEVTIEIPWIAVLDGNTKEGDVYMDIRPKDEKPVDKVTNHGQPDSKNGKENKNKMMNVKWP